jgi:cobalt-zinc-cadmium efflux system outer membrane protein
MILSYTRLCVAMTLFLVTQISFSATECRPLDNPDNILDCAFKRHPELKVSQEGLNQSIKLESFARQIPNPELDMRSTYGSAQGQKIGTTEVNLGFVLQLGGKRRARIQEAWAQQAEANALLLKTKEDVYISTFSTLIRLRQLADEIDSIEHAMDEFSKIQNLYRSYGRLNAEQQISMDIFMLAHADYRARKTSLILEQQKCQRNLQFILGEPIVLKESIYPAELKSWPRIETNDDLNGSGIKLAQASIKEAEAELKSAESQSWPDLRLGPSLEQQRQGESKFESYGFNLSIPIPLFNLNQGGRAFAQAGLNRAQANLSAQTSLLLTEKQVMIQQFNTLIDSLKALPSIEAVEKKHENAENFFKRGLLSTSLMVEYHRQIVDLILDKNELELTAMQSLWKIYAIEGKLFPVINN